jgi:ketosteroid isomerase-like protein
MDFKAFTDAWERGWNSHDLDIILSHYRDDITFRSKKAIPLTGNGMVLGKQALRAYWAAALDHQPDLKFRVEDVFVGHQTLIIVYRNHRDVLAAETLYFDDTGYVFDASACHGAATE